MGKDYLHIAKAKFKQGLIEASEVPEGLQKQWDRWNFDIAEDAVRENMIKERDIDNQLRKDLQDIKDNGMY